MLPLFVLDPVLLQRAGANRLAYLREALDDLEAALTQCGVPLWVGAGRPADVVQHLAATMPITALHIAEDYSRYAKQRYRSLRRCAATAGFQLHAWPGIAAVPPQQIRATGGGAFQVFTPYSRRWEVTRQRPPTPPPARLAGPLRRPEYTLDSGWRHAVPVLADTSPQRLHGGERAAQGRLLRWLGSTLEAYGANRDLLAGDHGSRLSADLHFGCVSPSRLIEQARELPGADAWLRQLCWRDFYLQALDSFPTLAAEPFRRPTSTAAARASHAWQSLDRDAALRLAAWCDGRTGLPIVDAGMRQLRQEGFLPGRARMLVAAFLTRTLGIDWRHGLRHFDRWLTDGDLALNAGNWQWAAGTGHDRRPNRRFAYLRQAQRFDPQGVYVRHYLPELAVLPAGTAHTPWRVGGVPDYPAPLLDIDAE